MKLQFKEETFFLFLLEGGDRDKLVWCFQATLVSWSLGSSWKLCLKKSLDWPFVYGDGKSLWGDVKIDVEMEQKNLSQVNIRFGNNQFTIKLQVNWYL